MKTFSQFIAEGKKNKNEPPNAVPGTYQEHPDGSRTYTLKPFKPTKPPKKPLSKSEILQSLKGQGGIGRKSVEMGIKQREKQLKKLRKRNEVDEGFSIKKSQQELEKNRKEAKERIKKEAEQRNNVARNAFRREGGMISYEKGPDGKVVRGRRTKDGFTPDP